MLPRQSCTSASNHPNNVKHLTPAESECFAYISGDTRLVSILGELADRAEQCTKLMDACSHIDMIQHDLFSDDCAEFDMLLKSIEQIADDVDVTKICQAVVTLQNRVHDCNKKVHKSLKAADDLYQPYI